MFAAIFALVGNLASSWFQADGNRRAAKQRGRDEYAMQELDRIAAAEEQAKIDDLRKQAQPGMNYLRGLISQDPNQLTPEQEQVMEETRRDAVRSISPGLRGSGRATTAIVRNVEENSRNKFLTDNRNQSINAAGWLHGMMNPLLSSSLSASDRLSGRRGNSMLRSSYDRANATTANANLAGETAGAMIPIAGQAFGVDNPAPATDYSGAQGQPADLGGSLDPNAMSAITRYMADSDGRERKYKQSSNIDARDY